MRARSRNCLLQIGSASDFRLWHVASFTAMRQFGGFRSQADIQRSLLKFAKALAGQSCELRVRDTGTRRQERCRKRTKNWEDARIMATSLPLLPTSLVG